MAGQNKVANILWALPSPKNRTRRIKILVDEETFFRYREKGLRVSSNNTVYYFEEGRIKYFKREIFNLTDPKDRLFFKTANVFDLRKQNLKLKPVPGKNRGRYCIQKPETM